MNPDFERDPDRQFRAGEKVYAIDTNLFDIYDAEVTGVTEDGIQIHYPDWSDDDGEIEIERLLCQTARNSAIFREQNAIRGEKERVQEERRVARRKREAERRAEGRKSKPAKAPRPPKAPRKEKPRKARRPAAKPDVARDQVQVLLRSARMRGIKTLDEFRDWLDLAHGEDEAVIGLRDRLIARFRRFVNKPQGRDEDDLTPEDEYSYYGDEEDVAEVRYDEPEHVRLPAPAFAPVDGSAMKMPDALEFEGRGERGDMVIAFDDDGWANCFMYATGDREFLILNGMKLEIRHEKRGHMDADLFQELKVGAVKNAKTGSVLYPAVSNRAPVQIEMPRGFHGMMKKKKRIADPLGTEEDMVGPEDAGRGRGRKREGARGQWNEEYLEGSADD